MVDAGGIGGNRYKQRGVEGTEKGNTTRKSFLYRNMAST
jgi:hypothetical protein